LCTRAFILRAKQSTPYLPAIAAPALGAGEVNGNYAEWCQARDEWAPKHYTIQYNIQRPSFSVLVPVYEPREDWLRECIDSVRAQTYAGWELILADDASPSASVRRMLSEASRADDRIKVIFRATRGDISAATNTAAEQARGTYFVFLDHDDILDSFALSAFAQALLAAEAQQETVGILYADEDRFDASRKRIWPGFKPGFSPEKLLATNYIHHPVAIRGPLFKSLGGLRSQYDGSQDHDLLLRAAETHERFVHIADILYHMRLHPGSLVSGPAAKPEAHRRDQELITETLVRRGISGTVEPSPTIPGFHTIRRSSPGALSISVLVIPENAERSTHAAPHWPGCEILYGSGGKPGAQVINELARQAEGEILIVASSLISPLPGWREALLANVTRPEIGLVTGRILYPNGRLRACGLVTGIRGTAGRWHHGCDAEAAGYGGWMSLSHEISAAPWQFCAIRKDLFINSKGFDESFRDHGFDIDLSLRLLTEFDLRNLVLSQVKVVSASPESDSPQSFWSEGDISRLWQRWGVFLRKGDPFYNPNLTLLSEDVAFLDAGEHALRMRGMAEAYDAATAKQLAHRFSRT
jgi:O-antigen biosynthesis protein